MPELEVFVVEYLLASESGILQADHQKHNITNP
jgi:hypothetical protein